MTQDVTIKQVYREQEKYLNQNINLKGWVRTVRSSKDFGFIELNDGSFFKNIQIVFSGELENFSVLTKLTIGSSLEIEGKLVESPAQGQTFEVQAEKVKVVSLAEETFPLQKKRHSFEFLRTIAHLRPRTNTFSAVFRVRSTLSQIIHEFFANKNFVYSHTPIISASDCEGAGEMFSVNTFDLGNVPKTDKEEVDYNKDFFGKRTGLTVSGQLNAEAMIMGFRNVYTFGPTFRAENSNTARHAAEFWMLEPEMAFCDLEGDMDLAEEMIKHLIKDILNKLPEEMEFFDKFIENGLLDRLNKLLNSDFKRITYTQAVEELEKSGHKFDYPVKWGIDLQTEHERYLTEEIYNSPVFVTDYPKNIKAFYMKVNEDGNTVRAMDLLVPGVGEIIGGSQREDDLKTLSDRMLELGLSPEEYWWYLDLRRYGSVEHSGFGLGFERIIMYLTGMTNIRDVIPFPRTPRNVEF